MLFLPGVEVRSTCQQLIWGIGTYWLWLSKRTFHNSNYQLLHFGFNFTCIKASGCEVGDTLYNGQCYALHSERVTFEDAEKACIFDHLGGHLAAFHSEEEYDFLTDLVG